MRLAKCGVGRRRIPMDEKPCYNEAQRITVCKHTLPVEHSRVPTIKAETYKRPTKLHRASSKQRANTAFNIAFEIR